jgi:hypothetical protein
LHTAGIPHRLSASGRRGAYFVLFGRLVGALLSSNSYVADVLAVNTFGFHLVTWTFTALTVAVSLFLANRRRPRVDSPDWQRRIALCCKFAIGYTVLSFILLDLIAATAKGVWSTTSPPMAYLCGALILTPALLELPFAIRTIPNDSTIKSDPSPETEAINNSATSPEGRDTVHA